MPTSIVLIPIHSSTPTDHELASFKQCFNVLHRYDIVVLKPDGLNVDKYNEVIPSFTTISIPGIWQSSLENYNKLKCSEFLYKKFYNYNYLLTYELDAYVFKDELDMWCAVGHDYIGAPWIEGWSNPTYPIKFIGVGNSGFSLRNVKSCRGIIKRIKVLFTIKKILDKKLSLFNLTFSSFLRNNVVRKFFKIRDVDHCLKFFEIDYCTEDGFWAIWMGRMFYDFKIAPVKDAISFSFEAGAKDLYILNNNQLPFGCHAWLKYDPDFWSQYIPTYHSYNFTNCVNNNIKNAE